MSLRLSALLFVVSSLILIDCSLGQTSAPQKIFGHYQLRVWNDQNGLPQNTVNAITRTRDGYLWLGTVEGLVRFDGVRFTVFDLSNAPALQNNVVIALLEDRAGTLWIGTDGGGLTSLTDGHFVAHAGAEGLTDLRVNCLLQDRSGIIWVGTEGGGVHRLREGKFEVAHASKDTVSPRVSVITQSMDGDVWCGTDGGLLRYSAGKWTSYTTRDGLARERVRALYPDGAGSLWIGTDGGGAQRFVNGQFLPAELGPRLSQSRVWSINADASGALWFGVPGEGLFRLTSDGTVQAFTSADGLPSDGVRSIYRDAEGSMWLGLDVGGLSQFAQGRFSALTGEDGLPNEDTRALLEDGSGEVWVAMASGVRRSQNGKFSLIEPALAGGSSLAQDRAGTIWCESRSLGGEGQLYRFTDGRFAADAVSGQLQGNRITTLLADRDGGLWIGTRYGGMYYRSEAGELKTYRKESGSIEDYVTQMFHDRSGALWVATAGRGITRWHDGASESWTTANGLTSNHVLSFHEDGEGTLWIGTHGGGVLRFKDQKFRAISRKDGLYDDVAFVILEDERGNFWMSGNKGIYRASRQELNDFAEGRTSSIASFFYGTDDGMLSRECNHATPAGLKTRDGRLWFPTIKGVVVVDPAQQSITPPQMAVERVRIDGTEIDPHQPLPRLHWRNESIEVDYTALSWQRPKQIRFRYRLADLDRQWTEAGPRRTAYFSHLPPGSYRFEVVADNGEGVWATQPAAIAINVLPPFWRTWWFLSLGAIALAFGIASGFRWREAQLKRRVAAQEEFSRRLMDAHESERRRIAAELHDGLGQTLAMIKNRAVANHDPQITEQSASAIAEMREIAHNLRPYLLDRLGLTKALRSMCDKIAETSPVQLRAEVEEIDGRLAPEAEISLYRVMQESLNNILKHSAAAEARIVVRADADSIHITIQDNGRGFDPQKGSFGKTAIGGFGLVGMAERVRLLGGTHTVLSAPGKGTTITIEVLTSLERNGQTTPHPVS